MLKDSGVQLTPAGRDKLEEELRHLIEVKRPDLATRILDANSEGDISDNSEYEGLKEELVLTDARIQQLQTTLENAEIIEHHETGSVGIGSSVTIRGDDGVEETWQFVSEAEADTFSGTISTQSPVGRALFGKKPGEKASVTTPGGVITYTVVKIA